ncbi:HAD-IIB family hydrolase [archaeon]|nr:HAD-IIB family hydrolase [archaeon]
MDANSSIVFSDLDGTLLDGKNYSFEKAEPALRSIKEKEIPLILCTSKTRSEIEFYRNLLENSDPFVVENGGAIYVPKEYFPFTFDYDYISEGYFVIELGTPYRTLVKMLNDLKKKTGNSLKGFSDMSVEEIATLCNLTLDQAALAKQREYDEPFLILEPENATRVEAAIEFQYTRGDRFYHITSSDKGKAVSILIDMFKKSHQNILSVGLGNRLNDLPLLSAVDIPILVQLEDGSYDTKVVLPQLRYAGGVDPEGWNKAVLDLLQTLPG